MNVNNEFPRKRFGPVVIAGDQTAQYQTSKRPSQAVVRAITMTSKKKERSDIGRGVGGDNRGGVTETETEKRR